MLYRAEIFYPSMRALAQQMGKERDYEVLISGSQSLLTPPGASEVDVKAWQVQYSYYMHKILSCVFVFVTRPHYLVQYNVSLTASQTAGEHRV